MSELGFDFDNKQSAKLNKNVQDSYVSDMAVHSSPEKIYPALRRRMSKRKRVPSTDSSSDGDEDVPENYTPAAPTHTLGKRKKISAEKVKRGLMLEKLKSKRETSVRKRLLSGGQSSLDGNNYSTEDDAESPPKSFGMESEKDGSLIVSDSESQEMPPPSSLGMDSDSEEDDLTGSFIVPSDSESQGVHSQTPVKAEINLPPSTKEAHARYVQLTLSSIVDSDFLESLQDERDDCYKYFVNAQDIIMGIIETKKNVVGSTKWSKKFKDMLQSCTSIEHTLLPWSTERKCQACQLIRQVTRKISLSDEETSDDDFIDEFQDFYVGCFCGDRALIYHQLHHYSSKLKEKCNGKLPEEVIFKKTEDTTEAADVVKSLIEDDAWLNSLFEDFTCLMEEADGWMEGGKYYKEMKTVCVQH